MHLKSVYQVISSSTSKACLELVKTGFMQLNLVWITYSYNSQALVLIHYIRAQTVPNPFNTRRQFLTVHQNELKADYNWFLLGGEDSVSRKWSPGLKFSGQG